MATNRDVKYLNETFSSLRQRLIELSKTYYPNTYNDMSPSSPGMMFMEMSAYVGDVMSFYLDNQLQENFTQFARQTNNLYELAYMFGYKPKATGASSADLTIYQQVPSKLSGGTYVPDYDYAVNIPDNTKVTSTANSSIQFLIQGNIDFAHSSSDDSTEASIYQSTGTTPNYFLLKKTRPSISATINTTTFDFTTPTPFSTVNITNENIIGILDIVDSDNNKWYEVDYLAQDMIYDSIKNTNVNDPNNFQNKGNVPYLLQLKQIQRRFATRFIDSSTLQLQFGAGNPNITDGEVIPNSNNVGLGLPFEKDKLTTAYSPTNFIFTNTYGIAPSSTTLTVRYLTGGGVKSNVPAEDLTTLDITNINLQQTGLNGTTANYVMDSLAVTNLTAADGGQAGDTKEELRQNTISTISAQQRSVTMDDYIVRALSMPPKFGVISKAYIEKPKLTDDQVSTIETLNLFILSQNLNGQFSTASSTLKKNLRTYLSQYRVIGDNIEIRDAFIINLGVDFEITALPNYNNNDIILECIKELKYYFNRDKWQINQPILTRDLFILLDKIEGVQTVKKVIISNKTGISSGFSQYAYDVEAATREGVIYPSLDPSIFEIKNPNTDIKGRVVPL